MNRTPSPNNLYLGAGNLYFDRFDADGKRTGYRHMGNVPSLTIAPTIETIVKRTSMSGARGKYDEIPTNREAAFGITLDEYDPKNLALALYGSEQAFEQEDDATVTDADLNGGEALLFDVWYPLVNGTDHPYVVLDATVSGVKQGMTTLDPDTDYELNLEAGLIRLLSTGDADEAATKWSGTIPEITAASGRRRVQGLESSNILGSLLFISATDQVRGPRYRVEVHRCQMVPDGDVQLISEEYGSFTIKANALEDITRPVGERYWTQIELPSNAIPEEESA